MFVWLLKLATLKARMADDEESESVNRGHAVLANQ